MKFAFIREHRFTWPIRVMCRVLTVLRSGFFTWLRRASSVRQRRREALTQKIRVVHDEHRRVYGCPRMHQALLAQGERVYVNTVAVAAGTIVDSGVSLSIEASRRTTGNGKPASFSRRHRCLRRGLRKSTNRCCNS